MNQHIAHAQCGIYMNLQGKYCWGAFTLQVFCCYEAVFLTFHSELCAILIRAQAGC